ncbi:MAG: GntR family transcriptional regulator [Firmicutes bacterium]|nr:GntR family transcriptional regulator [Bacillota bacterium]
MIEKKDLARYEQIALLLANDITKGTYYEGEKISGRSTLASKYNVSPETIRKALALLHSKEVVKVVPYSGTFILSRTAARRFMNSFEEHSTLQAMERRLSTLTKERNRLNQEIEKLVKEIVNFKAGMLKSMQYAEEIVVISDSPLVGKSVQEARLRSVTGVTVTAVKHKGRWYVSPGKELNLTAGDILLAMGTPEAIESLRQLASGQK